MELLSTTLINILRNYIPNKKVNFKCGEAPLVSKNIKSALRKRSTLTKRCYVNGQVQSDYNLLQSHSKKCTEMILNAKNEYMLRMSKKLNDPSTAPKSYGSIFSWFLNNKKIPSIPPIFHIGKVLSDFKRKAYLFNSFFASQCTSAYNSSVLPDINFHTNARLNSFSVYRKRHSCYN